MTCALMYRLMCFEQTKNTRTWEEQGPTVVPLANPREGPQYLYFHKSKCLRRPDHVRIRLSVGKAANFQTSKNSRNAIMLRIRLPTTMA